VTGAGAARVDTVAAARDGLQGGREADVDLLEMSLGQEVIADYLARLLSL